MAEKFEGAYDRRRIAFEMLRIRRIFQVPSDHHARGRNFLSSTLEIIYWHQHQHRNRLIADTAVD